MFKVIKAKQGREIQYNESTGVYRKTFPGGPGARLRHMIGFSRPPGEHFAHMARLLQSLGIQTPEIVGYSPYVVETINVGGECLLDRLLKSDLGEIDFWLEQYTTAIARTLGSGIFFADFHFRNYLAKDTKLYALDLDNYRDGPFAAWRARRLLHRMDRKILPLIVGKLWRRAERSGDQDCAQRIKKAVTVERISDLIRKKAAAFHAPAMTAENSAR